MKSRINIVWFKRDLRLTDHAPLVRAIEQSQTENGRTLLLYIFEPSLLDDPHYSTRHWRFVTESLHDLNRQLKSNTDKALAKISVAHADAISLFNKLLKQYEVIGIFSHQEIGLSNTFERDNSLAKLLDNNNIPWQQSPTGAVVRGSRNRNTWDRDWRVTMRHSLASPDLEKLSAINLNFDTSALNNNWKTPNQQFQRGGSQAAWACLDDFFCERGKDYHWQISKPHASQLSCSRMSPYLAWGNISLRECYQRLLDNWNNRGWRRALAAFSSRLHWHCHFIQKFESECSMQFEPVNSAYKRLEYRELDECQSDLVNWKAGQTGFPLVDACMRCLHATGYINFRMRAMLVSILCHHLNIDWRFGVEHLASLFLDFEPGIHYPQFQMQAGVTGINTIRIYNPTKQAQEHDSDAIFIKRWCPELSDVPVQQVFEPWRLTTMEQQMYDVMIGQDYPQPSIELTETYKAAQQRLWSFKSRGDVKQEANRILARHVRT